MSIFISCDKTENDSTSISKTKQIVQQVKNQAFSKVQQKEVTALINTPTGVDCKTEGNVCFPETIVVQNRSANNGKSLNDELKDFVDSEIIALYEAGSLTLNKISNSSNTADLYIFKDSADNEVQVVYPVKK